MIIYKQLKRFNKELKTYKRLEKITTKQVNKSIKLLNKINETLKRLDY